MGRTARVAFRQGIHGHLEASTLLIKLYQAGVSPRGILEKITGLFCRF